MGNGMLSFLICLLSFCGFYDFSAAFTGVGIVIDLFLIYKKNTVYKKKYAPVMFLPSGLFVWAVAVSFWAIDPAENFTGIFRGAVLLLWMYECSLMAEEQKERLFSLIPYLGSGMTVFGGCSLLSDKTAAFFWQARRLGGLFQYPNTYALFLIAGIIILVQRAAKGYRNKKEKCGGIANLILLLLGILLSGSRSMLLLLFAWGIYKALRVKKLRLPVVISGLALALVAGGYVLLFQDKQNVGRVFTLLESNSTLYGRLLYYADACEMICVKPFGLGYMGYHYLQPAVQSGVYTTRFVHNDWLQLLLDYGVVGGVIGGVYVVWQLVKGRQSAWNKELATVILLASFADFHLQYMVMMMLLLLCFDMGSEKEALKKKQKAENLIFLGGLLAVFVYFAVPFLAQYTGNSKTAVTFLESYTPAQVSVMSTCTDKEEAVALADKILEHNPFVLEARQVKVYGAMMDGDSDGIIQNMDAALQISKYDTELYKQYDLMLAELVSRNREAGLFEGADKLESFRKTLPGRLSGMEETTHPLAFKIRDIPTFSW